LASLGWLHCGDLPLLQFNQPVVYSLGTVQLPSRNMAPLGPSHAFLKFFTDGISQKLKKEQFH